MPTLLLIVEDDPTIRMTLTDVLVLEGYEVHAAGDGEAALALLAGGLRPALVLSDRTMPAMSGDELALAMAADAELRSIPFVLMTAGSTPEGWTLPLLRKPFGLDSLYAVIDGALGSPTRPGPRAAPDTSPGPRAVPGTSPA